MAMRRPPSRWMRTSKAVSIDQPSDRLTRPSAVRVILPLHHRCHHRPCDTVFLALISCLTLPLPAHKTQVQCWMIGLIRPHALCMAGRATWGIEGALRERLP